MKQIFLLFFAIVFCSRIYAYDFKEGEFYYNVTDAQSFTVEVTSGEKAYSGEVIIPESVNHDGHMYSVKYIGKSAFAYTTLSSILIPGSVVEIKDNAFYGTNIDNITFSEGLITIGNSAFGCNLGGLNNKIEFPNTLETIGDYAFHNNMRLEIIIIPASVKYIGSFAFLYDKNLSKIFSLNEVPVELPDNTFLCAGIDENTGNQELIDYTVYNEATLYVPEGSVDRYNSATGWNQFKNFKEVDVDSPLPGEDFTIQDNGIDVTYTIVNNLPKEVELTRYELTMAPANAHNQKIIALPSVVNNYRVVGLGGWSFNYGIESIDEDGNVVEIDDEKCFDLVLPEGMEYIKAPAFYSCGGLKSLQIPASIKTIDKGYSDWLAFTFWNHGELEEVTVAEDNPFFDSRNNCKALIETSTGVLLCGGKNSSIPFGVSAIGEAAFSHTKLNAVDIPSSVTEIREAASYGTELRELLLPEGLEKIDTWGFGCNFGLSKLQLPSSLKYIGEGAFHNCSCLESIAIPANVSFIGEDAFAGGSKLKSVYSYSKSPVEIPNNVFNFWQILNGVEQPQSTNYDDAILYVPVGCKAKYEQTAGWNLFKNIVEMDNTPKVDFNEDNEMNVTDVVTLINCISKDDFTGINKEAADVNGDGEVNVTDVVTLILMIATAK